MNPYFWNKEEKDKVNYRKKKHSVFMVAENQIFICRGQLLLAKNGRQQKYKDYS